MDLASLYERTMFFLENPLGLRHVSSGDLGDDAGPTQPVQVAAESHTNAGGVNTDGHARALTNADASALFRHTLQALNQELRETNIHLQRTKNQLVYTRWTLLVKQLHMISKATKSSACWKPASLYPPRGQNLTRQQELKDGSLFFTAHTKPVDHEHAGTLHKPPKAESHLQSPCLLPLPSGPG